MPTEQEQEFQFEMPDSMPDTIYVKEACREEMLLPAHTHTKDQIVFTTSGTLRIDLGEKILFVPEHHIVCIRRGITHTISKGYRPRSYSDSSTPFLPIPSINQMNR